MVRSEVREKQEVMWAKKKRGELRRGERTSNQVFEVGSEVRSYRIQGGTRTTRCVGRKNPKPPPNMLAWAREDTPLFAANRMHLLQRTGSRLQGMDPVRRERVLVKLLSCIPFAFLVLPDEQKRGGLDRWPPRARRDLDRMRQARAWLWLGLADDSW
jgi:hypothetical protein